MLWYIRAMCLPNSRTKWSNLINLILMLVVQGPRVLANLLMPIGTISFSLFPMAWTIIFDQPVSLSAMQRLLTIKYRVLL